MRNTKIQDERFGIATLSTVGALAIALSACGGSSGGASAQAPIDTVHITPTATIELPNPTPLPTRKPTQPPTPTVAPEALRYLEQVTLRSPRIAATRRVGVIPRDEGGPTLTAPSEVTILEDDLDNGEAQIVRVIVDPGAVQLLLAVTVNGEPAREYWSLDLSPAVTGQIELLITFSADIFVERSQIRCVFVALDEQGLAGPSSSANVGLAPEQIVQEWESSFVPDLGQRPECGEILDATATVTRLGKELTGVSEVEQECNVNCAQGSGTCGTESRTDISGIVSDMEVSFESQTVQILGAECPAFGCAAVGVLRTRSVVDGEFVSPNLIRGRSIIRVVDCEFRTDNPSPFLGCDFSLCRDLGNLTCTGTTEIRVR